MDKHIHMYTHMFFYMYSDNILVPKHVNISMHILMQYHTHANMCIIMEIGH